MAQARSSTRSEGQPACIGRGARVRGRIHGDGDLVVEGHVEGDLSLRGALTIAESGSVDTHTVEAESVTIAGSLDGDVAASGPVRLVAGARVRGNLRGSSVAIEDGVRFSGQLDCDFDLPAELQAPGGSSTPAGDVRARAASRR